MAKRLKKTRKEVLAQCDCKLIDKQFAYTLGIYCDVVGEICGTDTVEINTHCSCKGCTQYYYIESLHKHIEEIHPQDDRKPCPKCGNEYKEFGFCGKSCEGFIL